MYRRAVLVILFAIPLWFAGCGQAPPPPSPVLAETPSPLIYVPPVPTVGPVAPTVTPAAPTAAPHPPEFPTLSPSANSPKEWRAMFDYDAKQPLDIKEIGSEEKAGAIIRDITFASPYGEPVSAYLVSPKAGGPFPAVLYVHWLENGPDENRTEFLPEAIKLAGEGVISLLVNDLLADWPKSRLVWTGRDADFDRNLVIRQVVELRRALDLLSQDRSVDPQRIGYVGHDFGGMFGAVLGGVDPCVKTYVILTAVPDFGEWFTLKTRLSGSARASYDEKLKPVAPVEYVRQAAPASLFFQFGESDTFFVPKERAMLLYNAASQPKRMEWYNSGHALHKNDAATTDRLMWLRKELGLNP